MEEFAGHTPIKGLEHLGRHIRDARGAPSGSPANFEALRGIGDDTAPTADVLAQEAAVVASFNVN